MVETLGICLLAQVKQPDLTWREAKKLMKKDDRYEITELVDSDTKERMFKDHIKELDRKRTEMFRGVSGAVVARLAGKLVVWVQS